MFSTLLKTENMLLAKFDLTSAIALNLVHSIELSIGTDIDCGRLSKQI